MTHFDILELSRTDIYRDTSTDQHLLDHALEILESVEAYLGEYRGEDALGPISWDTVEHYIQEVEGPNALC